MTRSLMWLAAALCAFSASAAYALRDSGPQGGHVDAPTCIALPAPGGPPPGGFWTRTVDPGAHAELVRHAIDAFNNAGTALRITMVRRGAPADVTVKPDRELPGNHVAETRGCVSPGRVAVVADVTMDEKFPKGLDETLAVTRALGIAFGLRPNDHDRCTTMATVQNRTLQGCGDGYKLLQVVDRAALRRVWGPAPAAGSR